MAQESSNADSAASLKPIKTDIDMIIVFVGREGKVVKDYQARLVEISPEYFVAVSAYNIPTDLLYRAEGIFSAGRLMQPFPLAGTFKAKRKMEDGRCVYRFEFGGISHYAVKYIRIKSPRKGAGRPRKNPKPIEETKGEDHGSDAGK